MNRSGGQAGGPTVSSQHQWQEFLRQNESWAFISDPRYPRALTRETVCQAGAELRAVREIMFTDAVQNGSPASALFELLDDSR